MTKTACTVSKFDYCFGCGVCAAACHKQAITMRYDRDGFYKPVVDEGACVNCGICQDVCSFNHEDVMQPKDPEIGSYAAWSKNPEIRTECTSGGLSYELGKHLMAQGYQFVGVRYNLEKERAEHYIASTPEELEATKKSKYIQSWTVDAFRNLKRGQKYIITGTPCQIDSLRRYLRRFKMEDDVLLMDFFCHGIPTKLMFDQYLKHVKKKVGKLEYVTWRNKVMPNGEIDWQDSTNVNIKGERGLWQSRATQGDPFFCLFFQDYCLGKQCYNNCRFRMFSSAADIRLCDLWGGTYKENKKGVNGVILFSERANRLFKELENVEYKAEPKEIVGEGQMSANPKPHFMYGITMWSLRHRLPITFVDWLRRSFSRIYGIVRG